jgi:hypothetical protein
MLANNKVFCNTPWYEIHIYWDGSLGICCQEDHKIHNNDQKYNIASMTIMDWFNSEPARNFRLNMLKDTRDPVCRRCHIEEDNGGHSRRLKSNQKSVIFTRTAFDNSFKQSPGYKQFEYSVDNQGNTNTHPIDIHVDLGNYCNLACKMCNARASSTIASQQVKWGIKESKQYLGNDWTKDNVVWNSFKQQVLDIPGINNIHFMGGETLLTDRFEDFVDTMIENQRFDLCFSFVTNGTIYKPGLVEKLKKFRRVGFEVSIETLDQRNSYVRQGTDTDQVLKNIDQYLENCNNSSVTVALRPVPSLLTIGSYISLLEFALKRNLIVKSIVCTYPRFMNIDLLPQNIKDTYKEQYIKFLKQLDLLVVDSDYNASDPNNHQLVIKEQAQMCLNLLNSTTPIDTEQQLKELVSHCRRWDNVYKLDARQEIGRAHV